VTTKDKNNNSSGNLCRSGKSAAFLARLLSAREEKTNPDRRTAAKRKAEKKATAPIRTRDHSPTFRSSRVKGVRGGTDQEELGKRKKVKKTGKNKCVGKPMSVTDCKGAEEAYQAGIGGYLKGKNQRAKEGRRKNASWSREQRLSI